MKKRAILALVAVVFVFGIAVLRYEGGPSEPPYPPPDNVYNITPPASTNL